MFLIVVEDIIRRISIRTHNKNFVATKAQKQRGKEKQNTFIFVCFLKGIYWCHIDNPG